MAAAAAKRPQESTVMKLIVLAALALAVAVGSRKVAKAVGPDDRRAP